MAAAVPDTAQGEARRRGLKIGQDDVEGARGLDDLYHTMFVFQTNDVDNTNTLDIGLSSDQAVERFMWESTDTVQVNVSESEGVFTFATSADNANGYLHVWLSGN